MTTYTGSDGLTYDFTNNVLTISGSGASTSLNSGWLSVSGGGSNIDLRGATSLITTGNVTSIGDYAMGNSSLVTVTLGDAMTTVGYYAFNILSLKNVHLGAGVTNLVPHDAFGVAQLQQITVSSNSASYKEVNNVLYSKDGTVLVLYPSARTNTSYTVETGTTKILFAFKNSG